MSEHTTIDRDGIRAVVDARTAIVVEALAASYSRGRASRRAEPPARQ